MAAAVIEFQNVTKVYKRLFSEEKLAALSDVSFETLPGQVCAFLGPNGAGKTTSISILMGFFFPTSGSVRVMGQPPGDTRAKEKIGFLPENFAFHKFLTAPKLLQFHLKLAGQNPPDSGKLIAELLRKVKLTGYERLKIGRYSRGMVQRIGIAQALLCNPQLVVLDEPTSGLDPAGRREVLQLLEQLKSEGKTIFLSSHILPEVEQIADHVIIINRGKMVRSGRLQGFARQRRPGGNRGRSHSRGVRGLAAPRPCPQGVRVLVETARKREAVEALWAAGCDVVAMTPLRSTLEELFLKEVDLVGGGS